MKKVVCVLDNPEILPESCYVYMWVPERNYFKDMDDYFRKAHVSGASVLTCAVCYGKGSIQRKDSIDTHWEDRDYLRCPTCNGTGSFKEEAGSHKPLWEEDYITQQREKVNTYVSDLSKLSRLIVSVKSGAIPITDLDLVRTYLIGIHPVKSGYTPSEAQEMTFGSLSRMIDQEIYIAKMHLSRITGDKSPA